MTTHEMVEILRISDDPQKLAAADELAALLTEEDSLQARVEQVEAEVTRLTAELERLTTDLNWIHGAASWLKNNNVNPRAWQCIQDIIDRAEGPVASD